MSEALIEQFKKDFPHFSPLWINVNQETIIKALEQKYCSFNENIIQNGLIVYKICFELLWEIIDFPECYDIECFWETNDNIERAGLGHDDYKIARVIDAWSNKKSLSPICMIYDRNADQKNQLKLSIVDGNHRFSVLRYLHYQTQKPIEVLIMVDTETARLIDQKFQNNQDVYKMFDFKASNK
ncbi:hypothetical protein [Acinetobacter sp. MD2]|uniref:hypothetical protein n=1 Tax=Acinetobacter sp. MD2 TaxID=2600066 RepID=UPI002D1F5F70|nr:hypothetical protein [Acinetobacter sp. MD2]MEB3767276.1 hypothetical protein [Acinetobacter sp. MD2]